jgi:hypothetical protein
MNRLVPAAAALVLASGALAQPALYSNGSTTPSNPGLATGSVSASGIAAPAGAVWSEAQTDATGTNAIGGFACHVNVTTAGTNGAYRFADNFTVPSGPGWSVRRLSFFAYQTGATVTSPFSALNLRIWSGRPDDVGSTVVAGDTATNRLTSSSPSGIFRIFNSTALPFPPAPDSTRPIWRLDADIDVLLQPGTYWVDWQITSTVSGAEAFTPPVTTPSARTQPGWNGRQYKTSGGVSGLWADALDPGKPAASSDVAQDLPFIVAGSVGCVADFDDGSGTGTHDGGVGIEDLLYYLGAYDQGVVAADVDDGSSTGTLDGGVGIEDLLYFLERYNAGC